MYKIKAKPILVCAYFYGRDDRLEDKKTKKLSSDIVDQCELRGVELIGYDVLDPTEDKAEESRNKLVDRIYKILS